MKNYAAGLFIGVAIMAVAECCYWPAHGNRIEDDNNQSLPGPYCTTITYVGQNGRSITCQQCLYPASGQTIISNCVE